MREVVYRVVGVLCAVVGGAPIGTNLGLVHLLWMVVGGRLLASRGGVIPGLSAAGLSEPAARRAWAALGQGGWSSAELLTRWRRHVEQADIADPSTAAHERALLRAAVQAATEQDALVRDAGFEIRQLQEAGAARYVVRAARDITGRRAVPPTYPGRGRPRRRGELIRPLARTYRDRTLAATPPDQAATRQEGDASVRAA